MESRIRPTRCSTCTRPTAPTSRFPIYAFATSLGNQRVLDAARALAAQSHLPAGDLTLVDRVRTYAHCDPIAATPDQNDFLKTVEPFLHSIG